MNDSLTSFPIPEATLVRADPVGETYCYQEGERFLELIVERGDLTLLDNNRRVGKIMRYDPSNGGLWKGPTLLGKYEKKESGYVVTPFVQGLAVPEKKEDVHPLDYLLRFI